MAVASEFFFLKHANVGTGCHQCNSNVFYSASLHILEVHDDFLSDRYRES